MALEKREFLIGDRNSEGKKKNCEKEVVIVWSLGDKPSEGGSLGFRICLHGGASCVSCYPEQVFGERAPGRGSWGFSGPQARLCGRQPGSVFGWMRLLQPQAKTEETSEDGCALDLPVCLGNGRDTGTSPFRRRDPFLLIFPLEA